MAQDPTTYLAATVLNDGNIVTYRSVSRALKVNINVAKRILYEFHQKRTIKKAGSVHATYLVSGRQVVKLASNRVQKIEEDTPMQSSPFMSSSMPNQDVEEEPAAMRVMTVVREEHLEAVKAKYQDISSIHIYSLEPSTLPDLNVLSDVRREITAKHAKEDPLVVALRYGTILNPRVKRRTGPRPQTAPSTDSPASQGKRSSTAAAGNLPAKASTGGASSQPPPKVEVKQEQPKTTTTSKKSATKTPTMKREMSDIFKSFSKPKAKLTREETGSSHDDTPATGTPQSEVASNPIDEPMKDASEDEQEEDVVALSKDASSSTQRKSRSEREEALRRMMDDEEMSDAPPVPPADAEPDDIRAAEAPASQEEAAPSAPTVVVSGGRRRGKRQVMKKKTLKDEEGYLVTKEEAAWESFSEDEPTPASSKLRPTSSMPTSTAATKEKAKKAGAKPGQGNIMSFFGKK